MAIIIAISIVFRLLAFGAMVKISNPKRQNMNQPKIHQTQSNLN